MSHSGHDGGRTTRHAHLRFGNRHLLHRSVIHLRSPPSSPHGSACRPLLPLPRQTARLRGIYRRPLPSASSTFTVKQLSTARKQIRNRCIVFRRLCSKNIMTGKRIVYWRIRISQRGSSSVVYRLSWIQNEDECGRRRSNDCLSG